MDNQRETRRPGLFVVFSFMLMLGLVSGPSSSRASQQPDAKTKSTSSSAPKASPPATTVPENYDELQAVIETDRGEIVIEFFPHEAPNHVASFVRLARQDFYHNTTFHRILKEALIQGGDPLSRDPRTPRHKLGTGGLDQLKAEFNDRIFFRGTVGAVLRPKAPNSAGSQFFICVTDQMQLTKEYTAFGRVVKGIDVVEAISLVPTDAAGLAKDRVVIKSITIRPQRPTNEELKHYQVKVETDRGGFTMAFNPEVAPRHVRQFINLAGGGFYDGTTFHILMPGYLLQGGDPMTRGSDRQYWGRGWSGEWLTQEFNKIPFDRGTVGMMLLRPDDPNSGTCQFFICLGRAAHLDGKYTAFGQVIEGLEMLDHLAAMETDEKKAPVQPIVLRKFNVVTASSK